MDVREKIAAGAYEPDTMAARAIFRADLERENDVAGHPKAARLFEMAWTEGHSAGHYEVANTYENWVELIQP